MMAFESQLKHHLELEPDMKGPFRQSSLMQVEKFFELRCLSLSSFKVAGDEMTLVTALETNFLKFCMDFQFFVTPEIKYKF